MEIVHYMIYVLSLKCATNDLILHNYIMKIGFSTSIHHIRLLFGNAQSVTSHDLV